MQKERRRLTFMLGRQIIHFDAFIVCGLALHRSLFYSADTWRWQGGKTWQITHIASRRVLVADLPTGHPQDMPPHAARRLLAQLARCGDWSACEPRESVMEGARPLLVAQARKQRFAQPVLRSHQAEQEPLHTSRDGYLILSRKQRRELAKYASLTSR